MKTKNKITVQELEDLYNNYTMNEACSVLGVAPATFIKYLKNNNIPLKGKGNRRNKVQIINPNK